MPAVFSSQGGRGARLLGWAGRLALSVASLLLCLLSLELVARLFETEGRTAPPTEGMLRRHHPLLGWEKPPGATARVRGAEFDVELRINSHGLRGPERDYEKPPGVRRVLLLGDSFTEGYTVDEAKSARAELERLLNTAGCGRFEVQNGGVAGYGTDQEYLFYDLEGHRYGAETVVLLFFGNDLSDNVRHRKKPYFELVDGHLSLRNSPVPVPASGPLQVPRPVPTHPAWRGSSALEWLGNRTELGNPDLHRFLARLGLVRPLQHHAATEEWLSVYGPETPRTEAMWRITRALILALDREVAARGARLVVFYVPAHFEVDPVVWRRTRARWWLEGEGFDTHRVFDRLVTECGTLGVPLIDPRAAFTRAEAEGRPGYLEYDPHWTVEGNRIAAREIGGFLARHGLGGCALPGEPQR